jgi:TonB-linked SusC/RagA family outer membrane protein
MDMLRMLPTIPLYDNNNPGGYGIGSEENKTFGTNPVALQKLNDYNTYTNKVMGNINAEFDILPYLTYKFNVGFESNNWQNRRYRKRGIESYNRPQPYDELHEDRGGVYSLLLENTLNFNKSFGKHNIGMFAGVSRMITDWKQLGGSVYDFPKPFPVISAGTKDSKIYGTDAREGILGYLGRVTYDYSGKYLLTLNYRKDGSSKFGPNYKWGDFPGISAGWIVSEEDFFKAKWVNFLKMRASYGILGNSDVRGSYNYTSYINPNIAYVLGASQNLTQGAITQSLSNADLRWQSKTLSGAGFDASLFNHHIQINGDFFKAITNDVLVNAPIPWTTGHYGTDPYSNVGKIENHGVEFSLTYEESESILKYNITANISRVRNEVLKLGDGYDAIFSGPTKTTVGQPIGQFFVLRTDGIFQSDEDVASYINIDGTPIQPKAKAGDIRYKDINGRDPVSGELTGNPDGKINLDDREFAGSPWPDFEYGLSSNLSYKNWEMEISLQGSVGGSIFSNTRFTMERMDDNSNYPKWLDPWTETNKSNTTPRAVFGAAAANNVYYESDRWLNNASYLRLRSLHIGYNIPLRLFENVNIYAQAQNLFTLSSYKMWEVVNPGWDAFSRGIDNGTYPNVRSFIIGVKITY